MTNNKNTKQKPKPCTWDIVQFAMKMVEGVRLPKCVRDGKIKKRS